MTNTIKTLLPSGFQDVLPPEAAIDAKIIAKLLANFELWGYEHVKPPLMEFEKTLLSGKGKDLTKYTFRVTDPESGKMMGIRSDMTLQVARMAASRMGKAPRPLRLSYGGQVLRMKGEG